MLLFLQILQNFKTNYSIYNYLIYNVHCFLFDFQYEFQLQFLIFVYYVDNCVAKSITNDVSSSYIFKGVRYLC